MANTLPTDLLRSLPKVDETLQAPPVRALAPLLPHEVLAGCVRSAIDAARGAVLSGASTAVDADAIADDACARALAHLRPSLRRVVNATGVVVHTNLGRSALADSAVDAVVEAARGYSTLEYDTDAMARGSRHAHVEHLICALTGAEAAIAVNNNAAAVMMVLNEFARGHEAVVSRGELVEIGGSFRIPDIMALSDARMVEVGTTNKTHVADYERAITPDTAMLLKVHPSNYRVVGFSEAVPMREMRRIADAENARRAAAKQGEGAGGQPAAQAASVPEVLVYEDQGSGAFINLACFGEHAEPTVAESLKAGVDLVSFSGDKLLGGPQAGIVVGDAARIGRLKKNPLARALRLDKMTLAALEATLRLYLDPERALAEIPTLRMLSEDASGVRARAEHLAEAVRAAIPAGCAQVDVVPETARAGGGALPLCDIETFAVRIGFLQGNAQECEEHLIRKGRVPVIGRIKHECVLLDARTMSVEDIDVAAKALEAYFGTVGGTGSGADAGKPEQHKGTEARS